MKILDIIGLGCLSIVGILLISALGIFIVDTINANNICKDEGWDKAVVDGSGFRIYKCYSKVVDGCNYKVIRSPTFHITLYEKGQCGIEGGPK